MCLHNLNTFQIKALCFREDKMNRDDIIRMARDAGYGDAMAGLHAPALERFAALVAAHEREECAKFCEEQYVFYGYDDVFAAGIRARGVQ
jgi:hypothetical protein